MLKKILKHDSTSLDKIKQARFKKSNGMGQTGNPSSLDGTTRKAIS